MGFLSSFGENGEIKDLHLVKNNGMKEINTILERNNSICSSTFWEQKCKNLKKVNPTFFKFQSNDR